MKIFLFLMFVLFTSKLPAQCTPSVSITINSPTTGTTPCPNSDYALLANPGNIGPYQWTLNGITSTATGNVAPYNGNMLIQGDEITCAPLSNLSCPAKYTVDYIRAPYLMLSANPSGIIQQGENVTFTASLGHGASLYSYSFYINNLKVFSNATNQSTFSYSTNSLQNGDVVFATLKSNPNGNPCGYVDTSNQLTMSVSSILPVTLTQFNVKPFENNFLLNWTTVTEINFAYFNVQESKDGQLFKTIGKVNAEENSGSSKQYLFNYQPISLSDNPDYFRLQIIDKNGNSTYSAIQKASLNAAPKFTISPNPATKFLLINGAGIKQVKLLNMWGKLLLEQKEGQNNYQLNVAGFARGVYLLYIYTSNGSPSIQKVVLQ